MKNSFTSRIRYSECDENGKLSLFHMIAYMQDSCVFHGEDAGVGVNFLGAARKAWVLANWQIHIEEYPRLGETIQISTWPYAFKKYIGYRNFTINGADGRCIASANSEWVYLDMAEVKPVSIPEDLVKAYGWPPEAKLEKDFGKRKIRMPEETVSMEAVSVAEHHLDTNHHMNNAKYLQLAQACIPLKEEIIKLRMEFKQQAHLGDVLYPVCSKKEDGYLLAFLDEKGQQYFVMDAVTDV